MCILLNTHTYTVTIVLGGLCDNIGLVGVSAKWSYVTASTSHHDQAIPILSPLLFMHVGHPYIPRFKFRRIFDLLVTYLKCQTFMLFLCHVRERGVGVAVLSEPTLGA